EGRPLPQGILLSHRDTIMEWQCRQRAGAGLYNLGNTCYLNAVLQCLTYTPPLANYLLSREHQQSCHHESFCMMCIMEVHVGSILQSAHAIHPTAFTNVLEQIGPFQLGKCQDAHEFFCCLVNSMHRACLGGSSGLATSSQETTIIQQIFGGSLRSRVTCFNCRAVSDSFEAVIDIPLEIQAASSLQQALGHFVRDERMDGDNCFHCVSCDKRVAASKTLTISEAPKVLTLCLKRFEGLTGKKITKIVQYPEHLDLGPYMSEPDGERFLYSLYAVLVHIGFSCQHGHYLCYIKASNGQWNRMNDAVVVPCSVEKALRQQAYLLFYIR
ncbi:UBP42 hydrolase, partial [Upupa epops]|nr:UBP42 hydrolase [Upupa epops]